MRHATPRVVVFVWHHFLTLMTLGAWGVMYAVGVPLPLFAGAVPVLPACVVGYAALQHRRVAFPILAALGLMHDAIAGLPLGVTPLVWLLFSEICVRTVSAVEDAGFGPRYVWIALAITAMCITHYALVCWGLRTVLPLTHLLLPLCTTVLLYPLVHRLLHALQQRLYRRVWMFLPPEYKPVK